MVYIYRFQIKCNIKLMKISSHITRLYKYCIMKCDKMCTNGHVEQCEALVIFHNLVGCFPTKEWLGSS
jgi:hypothetical protein